MTNAIKNATDWQLGLASVVISAIGGLSSGLPNIEERKLYDKQLKQAPWAPPGWVFAPAWTINNFFILKALQQLLTRSDIPAKQKLLIRQAIIWLIFFSFNYIYFNKKIIFMKMYLSIKFHRGSKLLVKSWFLYATFL